MIEYETYGACCRDIVLRTHGERILFVKTQNTKGNTGITLPVFAKILAIDAPFIAHLGKI